MSLTSKQRAFLNSQAHTLKPIIKSGKMDLTTKSKPVSVRLLTPAN